MISYGKMFRHIESREQALLKVDDESGVIVCPKCKELKPKADFMKGDKQLIRCKNCRDREAMYTRNARKRRGK